MNWYKELIDPQSKLALTFLENEKILSSAENKFNLKEGIPIFNPSLNFDEHWENNATEIIPQSKLQEAAKFLQPLEDTLSENDHLKILDAGCGDGIHLKVLQEKYSFIDLYGIDISMKGLSLTKERLSNKAKLIQASIDNIPFENNFFDLVYSYGVIAYTPNPKKSFHELVSKTKKNGLIGIWIFPKTKGLSGFLFGAIRTWCKMTGKWGTTLAANAIVPFLGLLPTRSKLTLKNGSWRQCREIVMVNIAPSSLLFPEQEMIEKWFNEFNIEIEYKDLSNPICLWGRKK